MASRYGTLRAVSAASRTTGFALKAMPNPAAANMSMSLAPSPTAMVRARGTPAASAKIASAAAFPARSMIGPIQLAGDDARLHGQHVGARWSMPRSVTSGPITWVKPPLTTASS